METKMKVDIPGSAKDTKRLRMTRTTHRMKTFFDLLASASTTSPDAFIGIRKRPLNINITVQKD